MSIPFKRAKRFAEDSDILTFGVHAGKTIAWMVLFEPEYLLWATHQPNLLFLTSNTVERLDASVKAVKSEKAFQRTKRELISQKPKHENYLEDDPVMDYSDWSEDIPF